MRIAITFSRDLWQGHIKLCPFSHGLFASMQQKIDLRLNKDSFYLSSVNKCCCRCDLFLNNWQMLRRITSTLSQWKCLSWSHTRLPHLLMSLAGLGPEASWWYHLNSWNLTFSHFFCKLDFIIFPKREFPAPGIEMFWRSEAAAYLLGFACFPLQLKQLIIDVIAHTSWRVATGPTTSSGQHGRFS